VKGGAVKVLITGAGGQVGQALLKSAPQDVQTIPCTHKDLDIGDATAVAECISRLKPGVIINAAAYTAVDRAESEPDNARRINSNGPQHLARAARDSGARLVHISTDFVFAGNSSTPYLPDAPTAPLNVYGLTKRDGEDAVLKELPENSVVLRTAWVYAAEGANFVRTMLRVMRSWKAIRPTLNVYSEWRSCTDRLPRGLWRLLGNLIWRNCFHHYLKSVQWG